MVLVDNNEWLMFSNFSNPNLTLTLGSATTTVLYHEIINKHLSAFLVIFMRGGLVLRPFSSVCEKKILTGIWGDA